MATDALAHPNPYSESYGIANANTSWHTYVNAISNGNGDSCRFTVSFPFGYAHSFSFAFTHAVMGRSGRDRWLSA